MKTPTIEEIRRENLILLVAENESLTNLAREGALSYAHLNQIKNQVTRGNGQIIIMGSRLARKIEQRCGKPEGWMDVLHHEENTSNALTSPQNASSKEPDNSESPQELIKRLYLLLKPKERKEFLMRALEIELIDKKRGEHNSV